MMNGPLKFLTAAKFLPLLDLLAKFKRVLACSCSLNFCSCLHARFLVSIARDVVDPSLEFCMVLNSYKYGYQVPWKRTR